MSADHDLDEGTEIQWCGAPGCVRPVTYHPAGMHLTEQGVEFSDQPPARPRQRWLTVIQGGEPR